MQQIFDYADQNLNASFESLYNLTNSSLSAEWLAEKLQELWESNLQGRILAPCEAWCNDNKNLEYLTRHELVAKAKSHQCGWNALSGAATGAIPVPGLDASGSLGAGFILQVTLVALRVRAF